MNIKINNKIYNVEIIYKNNKNMYLRIKDDLKIVVTAPLKISEKKIQKFVESNIDYISKVIIQKEEVLAKKKDKFQYLGKLYDICYINERKIFLGDEKALIGKNVNIDNWYKKNAIEVFENYYNSCFQNFKEAKYKPLLKIRKMKGKWGVCNITNKTITLNLELIKLNPKYLIYVIYHELCHLKHPNHSKDFWTLVEKYVPNYKQIKKEMKNV
ncbi:MAG: M48 family metallopeptidase [Bacilli bacterium]